MRCGKEAAGYACTGLGTPQGTDGSLTCTSVGKADGKEDYCCSSSFPNPECAPDDTLACPGTDAYGYQCSGGADPTALSSRLTCSDGTPDPDGAYVDYCCTLGDVTGSIPPSDCGVGDDAAACTGGALGFDCPRR